MCSSDSVHTTVRLLGLATTQPSDGNPRRISPHHLLAALPPQVQVESTLDDAEEVLSFGLCMRRNAAVEPADRAVHGLCDARGVGRGGGDDVVELHDDVAADAVLERNGVFWSEKPLSALERAGK